MELKSRKLLKLQRQSIWSKRKETSDLEDGQQENRGVKEKELLRDSKNRQEKPRDGISEKPAKAGIRNRTVEVKNVPRCPFLRSMLTQELQTQVKILFGKHGRP